jgi:hypothetical protein
MVEFKMIGVGETPSMLVLLGATILAWQFYLVILSLYRLYLSPLAPIPGPKLAALTSWYEAYYEIVLGGQYSFQIDKLHDIYGKFFVLPRDVL